jgi:hypothetical protein
VLHLQEVVKHLRGYGRDGKILINFLRCREKLQKSENAKERGAFVVSINAMRLFPLDFPKIETQRRHALSKEIH